MPNLFSVKAAVFGRQLMKDLGLKDFQAAGVLGNAGHESGGFQFLQEIHPVAGRGGEDWFMWTGARRVALEAWCAAKRIPVRSDEASYGYLVHELTTTYTSTLHHLRAATSLDAAVVVFERMFEGAGVVSMADRLAYGRRALVAIRAAH